MFDVYSRDLKPVCCGSCGKTPPKLLRCTACKAIKYCSIECQRLHWRSGHNKECALRQTKKKRWEDIANMDLQNMNDATGMFILGVRHGTGDEGLPVNHELACKLYEAATKVEEPITGGHPVAMLHLALHYERGLGVEQSYEKAYQWYKAVFDHPFPGEDVLHAFLALSRFHKEGLGGAMKCDELHAKYLAFSKSNPERAEEIQDLEKWWDNGGKDMVLCHMGSSQETVSTTISSQRTKRYYAICDHQDGCISGDWDDETLDMLYIFSERDHAMAAARRAANEKNERYWAPYEPTEIQEKPNGWQQRGETSHRLFEVREIEVTADEEESMPSHEWVWGVVILQHMRLQSIESLFFDKKRALKQFDKVLQTLKDDGPVNKEENTGDILTIIHGEPHHNIVKKESYLVSQIDEDFATNEYDYDEDDMRDYIEEWSPKLDSIIQLVKIPVLYESLSKNRAIKWVKALADPDSRYIVSGVWTDDDRSRVLAKFDEYLKESDCEESMHE